MILLAGMVQAQLETTILNESVIYNKDKASFFTNRPLVVNQDNTFSFKNSSTEQTNALYFCGYNFLTDSIELVYRAINMSDDYPTDKVKNNILYQMYERNRLMRGIKNFHFVVGGYGKSFDKQVNSYMQRLKTNYGDSLFNKAAIVVFAWGTEDKAHKYYNALRASKRGAADFAIFQHMLDDFISDDEYFKTNPKDFNISIMFSSMGNELFRNYLINRNKQNIPLVKTYNRISFVGSVAPRNEFEEGNAFCNLHEMTDTVSVFVNSKDILLKLSSVAHFKNRMGNKGPKNPEDLPGYIKVIDIKKIITMQDMKGMGHDYILTNPVIQDGILQLISQKVEENQNNN
jgi:hypothetical protein